MRMSPSASVNTSCQVASEIARYRDTRSGRDLRAEGVLVQHELPDGILEISDIGGPAEGFDLDRDLSEPFFRREKTLSSEGFV